MTLEENVLPQNVTTDIATSGGQYDVVTIGTYEVPIWAKQGWLVSLNDLPASYDVDDLLPAVRGGLTVDGNLFAAPFYAESSMVRYRKDLMDAAGMTMPDASTWADIEKAEGADEEGRRTVCHLPARQGRLGRKRGIPDRDVQLILSALVQRKLGSPV